MKKILGVIVLCLVVCGNAFSENKSETNRKKSTIKLSCEIKKIDIDPSLLEDKEMLEDLIKVAFKDALSKVESTSSQKMGGLVPPGMNLPF